MSKRELGNSREKIAKFNSSAGFTLVEILIAVAILGAIAVGVMNLTQQTSQSTAKIEMTSDVTLTLNEINALLSDPIKCKLTFENTNTPIAIVGSYNDLVDPPTMKAEKFQVYTDANKAAVGSANLKILSYRLIKNAAVPEDSTLEITFQNKTILNKQEPTITRTLGMYVEWDIPANPNKVSECRTLAGSTATIWTRGLGTDIYYDGGNVGINTANPAYALDVAGDVRVAKIMAASFLYSSDKNLKEKIEEINNPLQTVLSLRGVNFDWKDSKENDFGFIAQEVQAKLPELVHKEIDSEVLSVDYAKVIPFLVEALKAQQTEIKKLETKIAELEKQ